MKIFSMNWKANMFSLSKKLYPLLFLLLLVSLISTSGIIIYQLMPKLSKNFTFNLDIKNKKVKILLSKQTINYLNNIGINPNAYQNNISEFLDKLKKVGIKTKIIDEKDLINLNKNDILIAFDTYAVSDFAKKQIETFLKNGGNLIFNYRFAYFNEYGHFLKDAEIKKITGLRKKVDTITKSEAPFFITKIMSPISTNQNDNRQDFVFYDPLPIYHSDFTPDMLMTNWQITSTPVLNITKKHLSVNDDGIGWHGFYGKGKWFYFSFPMYVFLDMKENYFKNFFYSIINYLKNPISIAKYPFLDTPNAVFISEDTEYKYPYALNFANLAKEKNIDVTLFCVAKLAKEYENITKQISTYKNCEIGSHSYSHIKIVGTSNKIMEREIIYSKKLLEQITGKTVYGFRPPREEIDKKMEDFINEAGYIYIMEKTKPYLLPKEEHKGFITLPRHGTDDYIYLIDTDWSKKKILENIIEETKFLTAINGIYTLSVHTHLLSYKSNISVLAKYFDYLNKHKNLYPQKGIDIIRKFKLIKNIHFKITQNINTIILDIFNSNNEKLINPTFRIYWPNIKIDKIVPEVINYKITIVQNNTKRRYTDIRINKIPPKTTVKVIIYYSNL